MLAIPIAYFKNPFKTNHEWENMLFFAGLEVTTCKTKNRKKNFSPPDNVPVIIKC